MSLEGSQDIQLHPESLKQYERRIARKRKWKHELVKLDNPLCRDPKDNNSDKDSRIHSSRDYWEEIVPRMNKFTEVMDPDADFMGRDSDIGIG